MTTTKQEDAMNTITWGDLAEYRTRLGAENRVLREARWANRAGLSLRIISRQGPTGGYVYVVQSGE